MLNINLSNYSFVATQRLFTLLLNLPFITLFLTFNLINQAHSQMIVPPITVNYLQDGKKHTITGAKTAQGYQFNSKSQKKVNLATLNWPPYISEEVCHKGWVFNFTVALLVSKGYQVNINFYPWARSVMLVEKGKMDILFPEYSIEKSALSGVVTGKHRYELLTLSDAFPGGKISLAVHKDHGETTFDSLSILHHKIVGVVRGYTNTEEIDAMIHEEKFSVVEALDELQLMKLLIAKRVDFVVGDKKVFTHTVQSSDLPQHRQDRLLTNIKYLQPALTQHALFYALSNKRPHHKVLLADINEALATFEQSGLTEQFMQAKTQCHNQVP